MQETLLSLSNLNGDEREESLQIELQLLRALLSLHRTL